MNTSPRILRYSPKYSEIHSIFLSICICKYGTTEYKTQNDSTANLRFELVINYSMLLSIKKMFSYAVF